MRELAEIQNVNYRCHHRSEGHAQVADIKTKPTEGSVDDFLAAVENKQRNDCLALVELMQSVTGETPKLWGPAMIGFGQYHYVYKSGREGDWFLTGFAPRKQNISIYIMAGFDRYDELMARLGKYKTGKSCLYVKTLADIDVNVLRQLVTESVHYMKRSWPS